MILERKTKKIIIAPVDKKGVLMLWRKFKGIIFFVR
jgi:hypothetical protein